jgi:hypothetical protein
MHREWKKTEFLLHMNLESTRPRNILQDEVREDGRIVGEEEWQKKCIPERNGRRQGIVILHVPME